MSRKTKGSTGVYDYLDQLGVLTNGSSQEIESAKDYYWKTQRKKWKENRRKTSRSYTVFLNELEYKIIKNKAENFKGGVTNYLKLSGLTCAKGSMLIDDKLLGKIHEAIILHYSLIKDSIDKGNLDNSEMLINNLDNIDNMLLSLSRNNKTQ